MLPVFIADLKFRGPFGPQLLAGGPSVLVDFVLHAFLYSGRMANVKMDGGACR